MADYAYEDLKSMTVAQLRAIAKALDHEAVRGYSQLRKDQLIPALCTALGIDMHVHHEVVGVDKKSIKKRIRALKAERDTAIEAHNRAQLKTIRRKIHRLKRQLHKATV